MCGPICDDLGYEVLIAVYYALLEGWYFFKD